MVIGLALGMIDGNGVIIRHWKALTDADEPADMWELTQYVANGIRKRISRMTKNG